MLHRFRITAVLIISALIGALLTFVVPDVAMAAPCPGNTCGVSGSVTVAGTLTIALDHTSFALANVPAGVGYNTGTNGGDGGTDVNNTSPYAVNATVGSNYVHGYTVNETLASPFEFKDTAGDALGTNGVTNAFDQDTNSFEAFSTTTGTLTTPVTNNPTPSAAVGDVIGLAWEWVLPANQPAATYTGTISVLALANP